MTVTFQMILSSCLLGIGLAMDAFSVSVVNGLNEPEMKPERMLAIAGTFGLFQTAMPLIGWFLVWAAVESFRTIQPWIPRIGAALLFWIGGKMLWDAFRGHEDAEAEKPVTTFGGLMVQGIATSIDALSVGFTMSEYTLPEAVLEAVIIGVVTLGICMIGLLAGRKIGEKVTRHASVLGGGILVAIGVKILVSSLQ